jgi:trans-aconitate 2-methyltransferase
MRWDPKQYGKFAGERSRPFFDLVSRVEAENPRRVVDLGCGPGPLTASLAERWPSAVVEGIDSSPEMIAQAGGLGARVEFSLGDLAAWEPPEDADVIVSNAALQWVPGQLDVFARWARAVPEDGWVAVQVPGNFDSPTHVLMRELAESARYAGRLAGVLRLPSTPEPSAYAQILLGAGLAADVWETTYTHVLPGERAVLEWMRGTGLRPVLAALPPDEATAFEAEYAAALDDAYPPTPHGTLLPFRRIFAVGHR